MIDLIFHRRYALPAAILLLYFAPDSRAQNRASDKDVESMMRNLAEDAKAFRPVFESDLHRSSIRKTSREKEAKSLAAGFVTQTRALLNRFRASRKADPELSTVRNTAQQIDSVVRTQNLGPQTQSRWARVQSELDEVSRAFGFASVRAGENPQRTSSYPPSSASQPSGSACSAGAGMERAKQLVDECLKVSPATHPPCNVQNPCALIIDEIKRSCALLDSRSAPAFCSEYR